MRWAWTIVGLVACDVDWAGFVFPDPPCEDRVDVDPATGFAELVLDRGCVAELPPPVRAEFNQRFDADWAVLDDPTPRPSEVCHTGSGLLLQVDLGEGVLTADPGQHPTEAFDAAEGTWLAVEFWNRRSLLTARTAYFRLGHPEDGVVDGIDCVETD